ncbi:hypothetical protein F383_31295 [Gossypium arboreum]|uniref:Myb/SANT-like domain-containing protein n=1 Tax=Gossypium arboreum TaxID=29729 RepID=A0A0B0PP47_GOSAR|nr:hypothetical protein F383_31295 [Gossypium arboreum]
MVDLYNVGTYNANMRFKAGYLNELERMLEKVIPHATLKAKLNLESRIRTLKRDWAIVYDMLSGKDNSEFGWDKHRQMVVAKDAVWNSYISSHKAAEIDAEDVATANNLEEGNNYHGCEDDVSLDEVNVSATQ